MEDVQNRHDSRSVPIDQVGVTDLRYPIVVFDRAHRRQQTVARLTLSVSLPHEFKGTHMSRLVEVVTEHHQRIAMAELPAMLRKLKNRLKAEGARIEVRFPYFIERAAPVSGSRGLVDYECTFIGEENCTRERFIIGVRVPVTSVCPCSKEISDYGAHNQRGSLSIEVSTFRTSAGAPEIIWIEELVEIAEQSASAPVYTLLKRADERHVTMQAYDNPVFVEDMVRNVAVRLQADPRVQWFHIHATNQESIHNHSAFAEIEWSRQ